MSYVMYLQLRHIVGTCEQEISFQTWAQRWGMNSGLSYREHGWDVFDKENSERRANGQGELLISPKVYWTSLNGSDSKQSACHAGDLDWIFGTGRYSEKGNGYPLQYFCLENSMDRGAWWLNFTNFQRNTSQNQNEISSHTCLLSIKQKVISVGKILEKRKTWYTADGKINQYTYYVK